MTVSASDLRSRPALSVQAFSRPQVFAATMAVLLANAVAAKVLQAFAEHGAGWALANALGVNWAFWLACAACVRLALTEPAAPLRPRDAWTCAACLAVALFPVSQLSAAACTGLAIAILADRTQGVRLKAAAMVLAAISVQVLWSRVLMALFLEPIASFDAHAVGLIIQRPAHGNQVQFVDGSHRMSILGACTSVQNAAVALMLYVALVRSVRPAPKAAELHALAGLFLTVVAINLVRLSLMAQNIRMLEFLHGDVGWPLIEAIITLAALAWAVFSVRREILR